MAPWPRFEVFKQDNERLPHQSVGSVHAPDAEMALLNAREVFGRRPSCISLWVVPEQAITAATAQELAGPLGEAIAAATPAGPQQAYHVFQKTSQKRSMVFVSYTATVQATSPQHALAQALASPGAADVFAWWVVPAAAVTGSEPDVVESWFAPASEKVYRQQSYYGHIRRKRRTTDAEPNL